MTSPCSGYLRNESVPTRSYGCPAEEQPPGDNSETIRRQFGDDEKIAGIHARERGRKSVEVVGKNLRNLHRNALVEQRAWN